MARVELASLGAGVIINPAGAPLASVPGTIYTNGTTTPVPVYSAQVGGTTNTTGRFTTDGFGRIPGWIDDNQVVDITVSPAPTVTATIPTSQSVPLSAEGIANGVATLDVTGRVPLNQTSLSVALTSSPNVFTAPQTIPTIVNGTTTQDSLGQKLIGMAASASGITGQYGGTVNYYGANAPAASKIAWNSGIDTAAATPYRDWFLARVNSDNSVTDYLYFSHNNGNGAIATGLGFVPPLTNFALTLSGMDVDHTQGGLAIRVATTLTTGVPFALFSSQDGNNKLWVDKNFALNSDGTTLNGVTVNGAATAYPVRQLVLGDKPGGTAGVTWAFRMDSDGTLYLTNLNTPTNFLTLNGSGIKLTGNISFFGGGYAGKQPASAVTAGYVAGVSTAVTIDGTFTGGAGTAAYTIGGIVAALKNLGLITF